jgi:pimeloyl-ACP methyl ester carboxylesterase
MKPLILVIVIIIKTSFLGISQSQRSGQVHYTNSSDGIRIAYEVRGEGKPALVFVHGWSCDRSYWKGQFEPFSLQYMVVAIDLGGHGESGMGRSAWTMEAFGNDVAAVVEKLGLQRVILIGHSMGGDVIVEAALRMPGRVAGLVMVDAYKKLGPGRTPEEVQAFANRLRTNFHDSTAALVRSMFLRNSDPSLVERVVEDMSSAPPHVALSSLEYARNYSRKITHTLMELKLPAVAINPDDAPTDLESMKRYGVEVMIMPGVAHFLIMEDPIAFNRILKTAIEKLIR